MKPPDIEEVLVRVEGLVARLEEVELQPVDEQAIYDLRALVAEVKRLRELEQWYQNALRESEGRTFKLMERADSSVPDKEVLGC